MKNKTTRSSKSVDTGPEQDGDEAYHFDFQELESKCTAIITFK